MEAYDHAMKVTSLLAGCINPDMSVEESGRIEFPSTFSIRVGSTSCIYEALKDTKNFLQYEHDTICGVLDTLYLIFRRNVSDIIRFRCGEEHKKHHTTLVRIFLNLLESALTNIANESISKRVIRLIGLVSLSGISGAEFKDYIKYLTEPSMLTNSLLQSLKYMLSPKEEAEKASPSAYFCMGGKNGSGIYVDQNPTNFGKDFQIAFWFKVEVFAVSTDTSSSIQEIEISDIQTNTSYADIHDKQHLITILNAKNEGFDIFLENRSLHLFIDDAKGEVLNVSFEEHSLEEGVWYHLVVSYSKPRWAMFNSDQLAVHIDGVKVFEGYVKFPRESNFQENSKLILGQNFNGNMGTIYVFSECLQPSTLEKMAQISGGKTISGMDERTALDLATTSVSRDPQLQVMPQRMYAVYHPLRVYRGQVYNVHKDVVNDKDKHGLLMSTYTWSIATARAQVDSLGGVAFLLPLFPRLLIEPSTMSRFISNDTINATDESFFVSHGTSISDIYTDNSALTIFSTEAIKAFEKDKALVTPEGCMGLLLGIITCYFHGDLNTQIDMTVNGIIEMIEYALSQVSPELLRNENENCVQTLVYMQEAASYEPLLLLINRHIVCNFYVWRNASVSFLTILMKHLVDMFREDGGRWAQQIGVGRLLMQAELFSSTGTCFCRTFYSLINPALYII
jgi:hypothetical protein